MKRMKKTAAMLLAGCMVLGLCACQNSTGNGTADSVGAVQETAAEKDADRPGEMVEISFSMAAYSNEVDGWTAMIEEANRQLEADGKNISRQPVRQFFTA